VTYSGADGAMSAAVLFATSDSGRTWSVDSVLTNLGESSGGERVHSTMVDSTWVVPFDHVRPSRPPTLTELSHDSRVAAKPETGFSDFDRDSISFVSPMQGWLSGSGGLLATNDGGETWTNITPGPPKGKNSPQTTRVLPQVPNHATFVPSPLPSATQLMTQTLSSASGISQHLGFDKSFVALAGKMQTWWNSSPYYDVGFYANGGESHATDHRLNARWVAQVLSQGWGLIPTWSGLQAPCACHGKGAYPNCAAFPHTFSSDPNTASGQGASDADSAFASVTGLGLAGSIIYIDIEKYDLKNVSWCEAAVQAFVSGWVSELHALGGAAGVYGSPFDAAADFELANPLPDDVWIARYDDGIDHTRPRVYRLESWSRGESLA
jgi:hypothetical protein